MDGCRYSCHASWSISVAWSRGWHLERNIYCATILRLCTIPFYQKFDPIRFSTDNSKKMDPFTYLAFSAGPRCSTYNIWPGLTKLVLSHLSAVLIFYQGTGMGRPTDFAQNFTYYAMLHCSKISPIMLKLWSLILNSFQ